MPGVDRVTRVYLDWNATTPPLDDVVRAMAAAAAETWGNPASVHSFGRAARSRVEAAREAVANLAGCDARDVVFTSGGTEANNLALRGAFPPAPRADGASVLVTSRIEHASVVGVAQALEREGRARVRWLRVEPCGLVDLEDLGSALSEGGVRLVAVQAVNSETGVLQPIAQVRELSERAGVRLHVDAVQAFGRTSDVAQRADTRSLAAHKIRGPKSIGALIAARCSALEPVLAGGSQERGMRPGTVDPIAAAGLEVAARHAVNSVERYAALRTLRDRLEAGLLDLAPGAHVNGGSCPRACHVTNISFPEWTGAEFVAALDLEGIAVSSGSACSGGTADPSHVIMAMGDPRAAASAVRFSLGEGTTLEDIEMALAAAHRVLKRM